MKMFVIDQNDGSALYVCPYCYEKFSREGDDTSDVVEDTGTLGDYCDVCDQPLFDYEAEVKAARIRNAKQTDPEIETEKMMSKFENSYA